MSEVMPDFTSNIENYWFLVFYFIFYLDKIV